MKKELIIKELNNIENEIANNQAKMRGFLQIYLLEYCPIKVGNVVSYNEQKGVIRRLEPFFACGEIYMQGLWQKIKKDGSLYTNEDRFSYIEFEKMILVEIDNNLKI